MLKFSDVLNFINTTSLNSYDIEPFTDCKTLENKMVAVMFTKNNIRIAMKAQKPQKREMKNYVNPIT